MSEFNDAYNLVYNIVANHGGRLWAFPKKAYLYIMNGRLFIHWIDEGYSSSVNEIWCKKFLIRKFAN